MSGSRPNPPSATSVATRLARGPRHRGDIMSPETRSALMARIKGKNTGPELVLGKMLAGHGLRWQKHAKDLPGRPDFVFRACRLVIFVDGDFWHGWRFSVWRDKLTAKWDAKISGNRRRDSRVHRALRRAGWQVIRIWEHQIERDLGGCTGRVLAAIKERSAATEMTRRTWPRAGRPGITASNEAKDPGFVRGRRG